MDFIHNRVTPSQPQATRATTPPDSVELPSSRGTKKPEQKRDLLGLGSRIGTNILLFIVALLIASVAWFTYSAVPASQGRYVDTSKLQAVFLNTGQVYFGNIQRLNQNFFVLTNVYYLQSSNASGSNSSSSQNQSVSLVKLGCELHKPYDRMVINGSQITFWENLQPDGQVAKAVEQFQKQNPSGQKCSDQTQAPSSTNLQNQSTSSNSSTSGSSSSTSSSTGASTTKP